MTDNQQAQETQGQEAQEQAPETTEQAVEQAQEQAAEQTEQATEAVATDPKVFDDDGKTWKSKYKEVERKYNSILERQMASTKQETSTEENAEVPATRSGVKQVLSEIQKEENYADQVFEEAIDDLLIENPAFGQFKDECRKMMKTLDLESRKNPETVKVIAKGLWGQKTWRPQPAQSKPVKKLVAVKQSDAIAPSPKGGATSEPTLTEAEEEWAEHHGFDRKGFSNEEIKDMFKLAQSKRNKQGG